MCVSADDKYVAMRPSIMMRLSHMVLLVALFMSVLRIICGPGLLTVLFVNLFDCVSLMVPVMVLLVVPVMVLLVVPVVVPVMVLLVVPLIGGSLLSSCHGPCHGPSAGGS